LKEDLFEVVKPYDPELLYQILCKHITKIEEKIEQRLESKPIQGGNLLLHHINEKCIDDSNDKASLVYTGI